MVKDQVISRRGYNISSRRFQMTRLWSRILRRSSPGSMTTTWPRRASVVLAIVASPRILRKAGRYSYSSMAENTTLPASITFTTQPFYMTFAPFNLRAWCRRQIFPIPRPSCLQFYLFATWRTSSKRAAKNRRQILLKLSILSEFILWIHFDKYYKNSKLLIIIK